MGCCITNYRLESPHELSSLPKANSCLPLDLNGAEPKEQNCLGLENSQIQYPLRFSFGAPPHQQIYRTGVVE